MDGNELTEYDVSLEAVADKAGIALAVYAIRKKVYAAIAVCYPVFKAECEKQKIVRSESYSQPGCTGSVPLKTEQKKHWM